MIQPSTERLFEITQSQLGEAVIGMAHYVEHLKRIADDPNGREIDVVLARHHLESASAAQSGLNAVFATTADEGFAA